MNEDKQALQTRLNSHTQEQNYAVANKSVSQNSHPIFNLSIFTLKEYLQNPIKKQPRKLLFVTQLSIKSHRFKDNTSFTTLQTLVNPSTEACWQDYFCILHWTVVGCRWASHHDCWSEQREQSSELHFLQTWILAWDLWTLTRKASLWTFQSQVWDRYQVAWLFLVVGRYGHGRRHSLRGLGNFRRKKPKVLMEFRHLWGLLMSSSNSEGQIKLTSKAWRQLLDLVQNCPVLQLYYVEADHNSTTKVLLTKYADRS